MGGFPRCSYLTPSGCHGLGSELFNISALVGERMVRGKEGCEDETRHPDWGPLSDFMEVHDDGKLPAFLRLTLALLASGLREELLTAASSHDLS